VTRREPDARRRKRSCRIGLTLHPAEAETIGALARSVGMSVASYLRAVGVGYQPRAIVDRDQVEAMLRVNGDLGRLGGLLKLWLTDDAKLDQFDRGQIRQAILGALQRIEENQVELRSVVRRALRDRGEP
jgi:hypothetical protein